MCCIVVESYALLESYALITAEFSLFLTKFKFENMRHNMKCFCRSVKHFTVLH